ncbi:RNA polymerase-binding transcription factor DksA [Rickettsiales endosymbiont of Paramecium tredecaurelia]|uniref:RNA polymerase-binding protein DksA n=1 Tax=Candidatus Sarmatiella mevalonica TaxID=2770581 RepID=UPI001921E2DF|nr:RNA polymerase-binding protein DksA [Candidatus Sarmatiella mevalonica]MBL3285178.1 RNA polymerase-binding transcription factor DksA [Candidatus Sarmatiella mevalonica]
MSNVEIDEAYRPSEDEEYMNPKQVEYFKRKLLRWKEQLLLESQKTLEYLKERQWSQADSTDRASVESETGLELRTRDRYFKLIEKIDAAIERCNKNTYGFCEETGESIGIRRLEARPIATLCIEAQEKHEKYERNHAE